MWNTIIFLGKKVRYITAESLFLVRRHRLYFLTPIFFVLALIAFFVFYVGPSIIIVFMYAGV